jgi:hypothetical protein
LPYTETEKGCLLYWLAVEGQALLRMPPAEGSSCQSETELPAASKVYTGGSNRIGYWNMVFVVDMDYRVCLPEEISEMAVDLHCIWL